MNNERWYKFSKDFYCTTRVILKREEFAGVLLTSQCMGVTLCESFYLSRIVNTSYTSMFLRRKMKKKMALCAIFLGGFSSVCVGNSFWSDCKSFVSAYVRSPQGVGSVIPSSRFVSRAMAKYVDCTKGPVRILEIGAGTGPVTEKIIEKMRPEDHLDVIEIDSNLCDVLRQKFGKHKNIYIHCLSVLDWQPNYQYDCIVSAIPHNTFGVDFVGAVIEKYKSLAKPRGVVTYIELMGFARIKKLFLLGKKRARFLEAFGAITAFRKQFQFDSETVALNIPPAQVYHLKISK